VNSNLEVPRIALGLTVILVLGLSAAAIGMTLATIEADPRRDHDPAPPPASRPDFPCRPSRIPADIRLADALRDPDAPPAGA